MQIRPCFFEPEFRVSGVATRPIVQHAFFVGCAGIVSFCPVTFLNR